MTMKKLTTKVMIAVAALVVAAGAVSAQPQTTMTAQIPFEFRAGNQVMAPGTYRVDSLDIGSSTKIFRLLDVNLRRSIVVLPQAQVDPEKRTVPGRPGLVFACIDGRCVLAELWAGTESYAYTFRHPKLGKDEDAYLRVIPIERNKSE
jgi:hypothetical protein